jgi:hypothetical protein
MTLLLQGVRCKDAFGLRRGSWRGSAVDRKRGSVRSVVDAASARAVAAEPRRGSETLGEWIARRGVSRDQVAATLTRELGKPISAKAVALYRSRPAPPSWRDALARSDDRPYPAGGQAAINGSQLLVMMPRHKRGGPGHRLRARVLRTVLPPSYDFWWILSATAVGFLIGLLVALAVL